jgi:predicted dehydrogenase
MGKRHLLGLLQGGFEVTAVDPRRSSYESAVEAIEKSGLRKEPLHWVDQIPAGEYDVAIFAETAPYRLQNLARFLENGAAEKILLEKPLSSDPEDIRAYEALLEAKRVAPSNVTVNLSRRTWPLFVELKTLCDSSSEVMMTVNGGAAGFGLISRRLFSLQGRSRSNLEDACCKRPRLGVQRLWRQLLDRE